MKLYQLCIVTTFIEFKNSNLMLKTDKA